MKKKLFKVAMLLSTVVCLACMSSCAKEGPTGPAGSAGAVGETGPKGDQGDVGNANVHSYTVDIIDSTWAIVGSASSGYQRLVVQAANVLTRNVVKNCVVLVYVKSSDFGYDWAPVPYYTDREILITADVKIGFLALKKQQNGKPHTQSIFSAVKVVTIELATTGTLDLTTNPPVDFNDYEAVKTFYGLED